jgi:hypothetical protein
VDSSAYTEAVWLKARAARWVPFANRWLEVAPTCCNACRTCTATNLVTLAGMIGGVLATPFVRVWRLRSRTANSR